MSTAAQCRAVAGAADLWVPRRPSMALSQGTPLLFMGCNRAATAGVVPSAMQLFPRLRPPLGTHPLCWPHRSPPPCQHPGPQTARFQAGLRKLAPLNSAERSVRAPCHRGCSPDPLKASAGLGRHLTPAKKSNKKLAWMCCTSGSSSASPAASSTSRSRTPVNTAGAGSGRGRRATLGPGRHAAAGSLANC